MAWKTKNNMMYDEEEEHTIRGIREDGDNSRNKKHKLCPIH